MKGSLFRIGDGMEIRQMSMENINVGYVFMVADRTNVEVQNFECDMAHWAGVDVKDNVIYSITDKGYGIYVQCTGDSMIFGFTISILEKVHKCTNLLEDEALSITYGLNVEIIHKKLSGYITMMIGYRSNPIIEKLVQMLYSSATGTTDKDYALFQITATDESRIWIYVTEREMKVGFFKWSSKDNKQYY